MPSASGSVPCPRPYPRRRPRRSPSSPRTWRPGPTTWRRWPRACDRCVPTPARTGGPWPTSRACWARRRARTAGSWPRGGGQSLRFPAPAGAGGLVAGRGPGRTYNARRQLSCLAQVLRAAHSCIDTSQHPEKAFVFRVGQPLLPPHPRLDRTRRRGVPPEWPTRSATWEHHGHATRIQVFIPPSECSSM